MAKAQSFTTEFNGSATPPGWSQFTGGSATFTYDATGATVTFPNPTSSATDGDITRSATDSLVDSFVAVNILAIPATSATTSSGLFRVQITSADFYAWRFNSGSINFDKRVASVDSLALFTTTWSATTHAWVRIRELNNVIMAESSMDGINWTLRYSEARAITITGLTALIGGVSSGVDAVAGSTFKWKNYNVLPSGAKFKNSSLRPYPFSPGLAR